MVIHRATLNVPHPYVSLRRPDPLEVVMKGALVSFDPSATSATVRTAREPGPIDIEVVIDEEDATPEDWWDVIEEGSISVTPGSLVVQALTGETAIDLGELQSGNYRVRVCALNRGRSTPTKPLVRFVLARSSLTNAPHRLIKDLDGIQLDDPYSPSYPSDEEMAAETHALLSANSSQDSSLPPPIATSWIRIQRWLGEYSPATIATLASGASAQEIDRATSAWPNRWPEDLAYFYSVCNGFKDDTWSRFFPEHDLLSITQAIELSSDYAALNQELGDIDPDFTDSYDTAFLGNQPAGSRAGVFIAPFVPIAERDGYVLFCDTRPGPLRGCITEFARENADAEGPVWASLGSLLHNYADSLEGHDRFRNHWIPSATPDGLDWQAMT